jgi:2-amino-4-hydroxy-6-hydroxymethyldihydropteridine diphosphokinase
MKSKQAAIGLGSNLGDSLTILKTALDILNNTPGIVINAISSWYQTVPIGPPQPNYINGCVLLEVQQTPQELLEILLGIETQLGRVRQERWGARTLDLDILLIDDLILNTSNLVIPHPAMTERGFVLVPLAEIAPHWIHPVMGKSISILINTINISGVSPI